MNWRGFNIDGQYYDLTHLCPFVVSHMVDDIQTNIRVTFGHHCFTDEKENGRCLFKPDQRYWSQERYDLSFNLPVLVRDNLFSNSSYAVPYMNRHSNEQYHYMEAYDYAIFFDINKPSGSGDSLKVKIISAYEVDEWGKSGLPKGKAKRVSWILSQRLKGNYIL